MIEYYLLRYDGDGTYLANMGDAVQTSLHADDHCMWLFGEGGTIKSATTGLSLPCTCYEDVTEQGFKKLELSCLDECVGAFDVVKGPSKLPSECLQDLRMKGYTTLDNVLSEACLKNAKHVIKNLRAQNHYNEHPVDGHFWIQNTLASSSVIAQAVTHPVAMWLMEQYMNGEVLHYCNEPIVNVIKPASKMQNRRSIHPLSPSNWHTDYPYHPHRLGVDTWDVGTPLGVQYNICIDEFRKDNGGTQFVLGSHLSGRAAPKNLHTFNGLVIEQMTAPAGSAIIYDARLWHRQCEELNISGADRTAVLNAAIPQRIVPMSDKTHPINAYLKSEIPNKLNSRDRLVVSQMCLSHAQAVMPVTAFDLAGDDSGSGNDCDYASNDRMDVLNYSENQDGKALQDSGVILDKIKRNRNDLVASAGALLLRSALAGRDLDSA